MSESLNIFEPFTGDKMWMWRVPIYATISSIVDIMFNDNKPSDVDRIFFKTLIISGFISWGSEIYRLKTKEKKNNIM